MDLDKLSNGEKISGISAILLFIFMFFDWFSVEVSGGSGAFHVSASEGGSAWDALEYIPIVLVIAIIAALAVVALRMTDANYEPPVPASTVVTALGGLSALLILYRIIITPDVGSFPGISVDVSPSFGIFLALIAAVGITYGGYRSMQEEGASFGDIGDRLGGGSPPPPPPPPSAGTPPPTAPPADPGGQVPPPPPPSSPPPPGA